MDYLLNELESISHGLLVKNNISSLVTKFYQMTYSIETKDS